MIVRQRVNVALRLGVFIALCFITLGNVQPAQAAVTGTASLNLKLPFRPGKEWKITSGTDGNNHTTGTYAAYNKYAVDFVPVTGYCEGEPILTVAPGRVEMVDRDSKGANRVFIDHGNNYHSLYAHLATVLVTQGTEVFHGTQIGTCGHTGEVYPASIAGSHLHLVLYQGVWGGGGHLVPVPIDTITDPNRMKSGNRGFYSSNGGDRVVVMGQRLLRIKPNGEVFAHQVSGTSIGNEVRLPGGLVGGKPHDTRVLAMGNRLLVVNARGEVWAHDVNGDQVGTGYQLTGSTVGAASWDRFVLAMNNRLLVINGAGEVWAHDVNGNQVGGGYKIGDGVAGNNWDRRVVVWSNRLLVINDAGEVWGHDVNSGSIGTGYRIPGSNVGATERDRRVVVLGDTSGAVGGALVGAGDTPYLLVINIYGEGWGFKLTTNPLSTGSVEKFSGASVAHEV